VSCVISPDSASASGGANGQDIQIHRYSPEPACVFCAEAGLLAPPPSLKSPASCASLSHLLRAYINKPSTDCILRVKGGWRASPALLGPLPIEHTTTPADCRDWHSPHTRPEHRHTRPHLVTHRHPATSCQRCVAVCWVRALWPPPLPTLVVAQKTPTPRVHTHIDRANNTLCVTLTILCSCTCKERWYTHLFLRLDRCVSR
jgi:hypothetical protein